MTELFEALDAHDHRWVAGLAGPLGELNRAGLLAAGDVRTAQAVVRLGAEPSPTVELAVALLVRAARNGSVCVDLHEVADLLPDHPWPEPDAWLDEVLASPLTGVALRVEAGLLYLHRYWAEEGSVVDDLKGRLARQQPVVDEDRLAAALDRLFPDSWSEQREAAAASVRRWTSVITGGPGTGKTATLARLLAVIADASDAPPRIALAAPTGKAAARMTQSVAGAAAEETFPEGDRSVVEGLTASTLHRLLGFRSDNHSRFRHHRGNQLPHDVVVVDEASMVSLSLMARLVEAIRPDARLVLLGDADQLASVEAGAVLRDVVTGFAGRSPSPVSLLETSRRYGPDIEALATAVRTGDATTAWELLSTGTEAVQLIDPADTAAIRDVVAPRAAALLARAQSGDPVGTIEALNAHKVLCAHRHGPWGVTTWNDLIAQWLQVEVGLEWLPYRYPGQPLIQTSNDYGLRLWNGDTGVVLGGDDARAVFDDGSEEGRLVSLSRLADVEVAHALTVHRSQGSEFGEVTVVLPDSDSRLLNRQLLYTAITRAVRVVRVVGTREAVEAAILREARRSSGLAGRLRDEG